MLSDPKHILHVEDSDEDAALIAHLLRGYGYRLSRVSTYGEMISFASHPDVVLLDLRVPGSDNPLRLVSDASRRFRNAGLILLTGIADPEGEELSVRAMAEGAQVRLIKGTFDKRRLWLSIREAYQQRQHFIRQLRESRSDMRVDPQILQESIRGAIPSDLEDRFRKLDEHNTQILRKLRKLGAEDTQPIDLVIDSTLWRQVFHWASRHDKVFRWVFYIVGVLYLAAGDYITGFRNAVLETNERVREIHERLEELERPKKDR